jgi:dinuclear metal center YbgI/SA1388 family protein
MPTPVAEIVAEADRLLEPARFEDSCLNGLQVPGRPEVERIATGVSAHVELFERAAEAQAGLLLVHHGLIWGPGVKAIDASLHRRLKILFANDIALAAYHLPLDAHPELGNNALLARALGAEHMQPFGAYHGQTIGFLAALGSNDGDGGIEADELFARVGEVTAREPLVLGDGPPRIQSLAIVSGAGSDFAEEAAAAGAQALLTGEPAERVTATARELGLHVIAAGHHATETLGIRALGELLAGRFGLEHVFIDVPNPV